MGSYARRPPRRSVHALSGHADVSIQIEDPEGQDLDVVRRVVDDVDPRVRGLLSELGVPVA